MASINGIAIRCPRCLANMETHDTVDAFVCSECRFPMEQWNGIWLALPVERKAYYACFIKDYEMIRAAEGRGSHASEYYLGLPYVDHSGNNKAQWRIRARTFTFLKKIFADLKASKPDGVRVLDIGAGTGWLSYRLMQMDVRSIAIDLLVNETDGLGAAVHYDRHLQEPFLRVQAESTRLPFRDGQFDAAIFNASFHYAESYEKCLRESFRCLRPGGVVIIADSPWYTKQRSGDRMLAERRSQFLGRFGTFSNSIRSQEFLTDERLRELEVAFGIEWERHTPYYGLRWSLRPWVAKLRNRREPATFRVYTAKKPS
jgi:ubiquinone/menaquinone biosynthesis C-methylase UbiE